MWINSSFYPMGNFPDYLNVCTARYSFIVWVIRDVVIPIRVCAHTEACGQICVQIASGKNLLFPAWLL